MNELVHIKTGNDFNKGFTLVEILVALTIISIVIAGVIYSYSGQQKSELSQTQLVEMQQSIRAAMYMMAADIRMAGYDPHRAFSAGVTQAGEAFISSPPTFISYPFTFTFVENETDKDPGTLATVSYDLYDASSDGDNDIGRQKDGLKQAIAENIESLTFTYLDSDGNDLADPIDLSAIRAVRIDITARLDEGAVDHTIPGAERTVSAVVKCRNLGL